MIELHNVSKAFNEGAPNEFTALRDITLSIPLSGITVLSGPSGSGKTTLLSLVGCMARPTSGRILLNGKNVSGLPERFLAAQRRRIFGFTFQQFHLIRGMRVQENIMAPAYPLGLPHKTLVAKATALLERFELADRADEFVENLSGGQQQRCAIARALINDPSVIIADEPTAHLDGHLSKTFLKYTEELKAEGKTLILASHDPLVLEHSCVDCIVTMHDGQISDTAS